MKPGIEIWRIEKLNVVKKGPSDKSHEGKFHTGDSYIILYTKVSKPSLFEAAASAVLCVVCIHYRAPLFLARQTVGSDVVTLAWLRLYRAV